MLTDTQAVVTAAGLDKFALLGISQGCAFSIRYAVEHPEQVCCLVLYGGYLRGRLRRSGPEQRQLFEVLTAMIRDGWGSPNPIFRHFFTSTFIPDASPKVANSFDELQRVATSSENALRIWEMNAQVDVTELAKRVSVPTLVLHCNGDRVVPYDEGRQVAKMIPGAQFVELSGNNHVLLAGTPALDEFFHHVSAFLSNHSSPSVSTDPNTGSQRATPCQQRVQGGRPKPTVLYFRYPSRLATLGHKAIRQVRHGESGRTDAGNNPHVRAQIGLDGPADSPRQGHQHNSYLPGPFEMYWAGGRSPPPVSRATGPSGDRMRRVTWPLLSQ